MILSGTISILMLIISYNWVNPPSTWLIIDRYFFGNTTQFNPVMQQWVPIDSISSHMILAAVAAEDNLFTEHRGFDIQSIREAREQIRQGKRVRGASTISMQVSKNVFLWHTRTWTRKFLEAGFTLFIETFWSKRRIMEVYLNIAEFGPSIYGIEAASNHFFNKKAKDLTRNQAALLTSVLPNPLHRNASSPTPYMRNYQLRVLRNMRNIQTVDLSSPRKNLKS
jgi:monofunctional glycosyltransferase